jgi:lipopolysaccharide assembly protein A
VRIVYRAVFLVVAILLILFAVSNRQTVSVGFWPLPFLADIALYLLCFLSLLVGFVLGLSTGWVGGRGARRDLKGLRRRIAALEQELAATQSQFADTPQTVSASSPASRQLS